MKIMPSFPETKIEAVDGVITIIQEYGYRTNTIQIPAVMWTYFCEQVEELVMTASVPADIAASLEPSND